MLLEPSYEELKQRVELLEKESLGEHYRFVNNP